MTRIDLPYLWKAKKGRYWFYRRDGKFTPIKDQAGRHLKPGDDGFLEAYERIHQDFGKPPGDAQAVPGTLAHLIDEYRKSPEFKQRSAKTKRDYCRYLDILKAKHGHRWIAKLPSEAVLKIRDKYQDTPRTANYIVAVLCLILSYAAKRKRTFKLPQAWVNPALGIERLETGEGHRPWEEVEIEAFRRHWPVDTLERVLFEAFLNTGQRGGDIAPMIRQQYFRGEMSVAQEKTKERVWIPTSLDLRDVLDPWLASHTHVVLFPTERGRQLKVDHMRHLMRDAIRAARLPDACALHGLRYTFATRAIELGLDWQTIESIVGHKTAEMAQKYTAKRRNARLAIAALDAVRKQNVDSE